MIISPPQVLENLNIQAVVITSFGRQDEIHEQVKGLVDEDRVRIIRL